ncbi:MAG TPA: hypothetical protein VJ927_03185 [Actinomycetota bacterium]|nr:hypothetical protein [Actinomycetota bacterium]
MTAQAHDRLRWRGGDYLLVGVDGDVLFDPLEHGLNPAPTTTANWRGWVAVYAVRDDRLLLAELTDVGFPRGPGASPPALRGVRAVGEREHGPFRYEELDWALDFSGRMIVARGFIQSLYRHMGFHPAWKFEESWELDFDKGRLSGSRELSEEMARFRKKIEKDPTLDPDHEARPGWLERTFTLAFRRSKGP